MKKAKLYINPESGHSRKLSFDTFEEIFARYNYEVEFVFTEYAGHLTKLVKEDTENLDLVISLGGDGTYNEMLNGNLSRKTPYLASHIPMGTTNDIGRMYGFVYDPYTNLEFILDGKVRTIDVLSINGIYFGYVAGFGKFLDIPYKTERKSKKLLGHLAYLIEGFKDLFRGINTYEIVYREKGKLIREEVTFLIISNSTRIAGVNNFYRGIKLNDGKFELLYTNLKKKKDILKVLFTLVVKDASKAENITFKTIRSSKIQVFPNPSKWCLDGEFKELENPIEISLKSDYEMLFPKHLDDDLF